MNSSGESWTHKGRLSRSLTSSEIVKVKFIKSVKKKRVRSEGRLLPNASQTSIGMTLKGDATFLDVCRDDIDAFIPQGLKCHT